MNEKSPQSRTLEERTVVSDPMEVVGLLREMKRAQEWVDDENAESSDDFKDYLNSRPDGKNTYYTTSELEREASPLKTGLFIGDIFKNSETGSSLTITDTREIGNQKVYRLVKESIGKDGKTKKAIFELPEEGARAYLSESGTKLQNETVDTLVEEPNIKSSKLSIESKTPADTQVKIENNQTQETGKLNSPELKKVFEKTYTLTANDIKNLIINAKETATSAESAERITLPETAKTHNNDMAERRIMGVTQDHDEIRAMAEVVAMRQATNAERIALLKERVQQAKTQDTSEIVPQPKSTAQRIADLKARLENSNMKAQESNPITISASEKPIKKRSIRTLFRGLKNKVTRLFNRRSENNERTYSDEEQIQLNNAANWATVARAEVPTDKASASATLIESSSTKLNNQEKIGTSQSPLESARLKFAQEKSQRGTSTTETSDAYVAAFEEYIMSQAKHYRELGYSKDRIESETKLLRTIEHGEMNKTIRSFSIVPGEKGYTSLTSKLNSTFDKLIGRASKTKETIGNRLQGLRTKLASGTLRLVLAYGSTRRPNNVTNLASRRSKVVEENADNERSAA